MAANEPREDPNDPGLSVMLDAIRRRDLLENNLSDDEQWVEVDTEISGAPVQIRILLAQNKWSASAENRACPPVALLYESRMDAWNLDYMVEAFDAIYGRHPAITGPWVTITRTGDERTYDGRDAWEMRRVASMFRTQSGLKPMRGEDVVEDPDARAGVEEDVVAVQIHTAVQITRGMRMKDTAIEFHRDEDRFVEMVRFGTGPLARSRPELLERVVQNILWGSEPDPADVETLRARVADLVALLLPRQGGPGGGMELAGD